MLGGIVNHGGRAGDLVRQLGVSKQAASQLLDSLVLRGYLVREPDPGDGRRVAITATERGRAAAAAIRQAVVAVDDELAGLRAGLIALCDIRTVSRTKPAPAAASPTVDATFDAELFEWRGPAPFYWLTLPDDACDYVRADANQTTYGWGAIPVRVRIGGTEWETSLLPRNGGYVLPVKAYVRQQEHIGDGDTVTVELTVAPRGGRAANGTGPAG